MSTEVDDGTFPRNVGVRLPSDESSIPEGRNPQPRRCKNFENHYDKVPEGD